MTISPHSKSRRRSCVKRAFRVFTPRSRGDTTDGTMPVASEGVYRPGIACNSQVYGGENPRSRGLLLNYVHGRAPPRTISMTVSLTANRTPGPNMAREAERCRVVVLGSYAPALITFRGPLLRAMRANGHRVLALAPEHDEIVANTLKSMGVEFGTVPMARATIDPLADLRTI